MRDPVIYRILHCRHHRQGDKWCIYPLYDFAHPIQDALEGITHSMCSIEFENHRPLYEWVIDNVGFEKKPKLVFVNHGEDAVTDAFAGYLETEHGYKAFAPYSGTVFDLAEGKFLVCPKGVPVKKAETASGAKASGLYQKLVAAGESLLSLIRASRGKPNKTLKHFLSDVEELLKKYR